MRESQVEDYLKKQVKKLGGRAMKFVSPAFRGRPDQIVIINSHVVFVEVKTETGRLSPLQLKELAELEKHGCTATVVYGVTGVDGFIEDLIKLSKYEIAPVSAYVETEYR